MFFRGALVGNQEEGKKPKEHAQEAPLLLLNARSFLVRTAYFLSLYVVSKIPRPVQRRDQGEMSSIISG